MCCRMSNPSWPMVAIAPEGMTSNNRSVLRFRSGAFVLHAPVLPVCISYQWKHVNPSWTLCNEPWHILRLLTQFVNFATVEILPAHAPNADEAAHPTTFAANVLQGMVRFRAACGCRRSESATSLLCTAVQITAPISATVWLPLATTLHKTDRCGFGLTFLLDVQSEALGKPLSQCGIAEYHSLYKMGISVDWRGKLVAPEGRIDSEGYVPMPRRRISNSA
jgi:hypothetical protein